MEKGMLFKTGFSNAMKNAVFKQFDEIHIQLFDFDICDDNGEMHYIYVCPFSGGIFEARSKDNQIFTQNNDYRTIQHKIRFDILDVEISKNIKNSMQMFLKDKNNAIAWKKYHKPNLATSRTKTTPVIAYPINEKWCDFVCFCVNCGYMSEILDYSDIPNIFACDCNIYQNGIFVYNLSRNGIKSFLKKYEDMLKKYE